MPLHSTRKANEIVDALALRSRQWQDEILTSLSQRRSIGRNNKGQKNDGAQQTAKGILGFDANPANNPQAAFIAGLPQVLSLTPLMKRRWENEGYGTRNQAFQRCRYNMYRTGVLSQEDYSL